MVTLRMSRKATEELTHTTAKDDDLQLLIKFIQHGFPEKLEDLPLAVRHYHNFRDELAYYNGIVFKGNKVIVPEHQVPKMLEAIHTGHFGINSCRKRARDLLY